MRKKMLQRMKEERFPRKLFFIYLGVLLIMAAFQTTILVIMGSYHVNEGLQAFLTIVYWSAIAAGLTLYTRHQMRNTYEKPMMDMAVATKQVSEGDFSVYLPTVNSPDKYDYLDQMIIDFNKMVEELGSIETLKTDFISNVSHEMKTPIAVIKNYSQLMSKGKLTQEQYQEYSLIVMEAADRMNKLIGNILKLNKLENQGIIPEMEDYDICGQIMDCVLVYEAIWDQKEIELEIELNDITWIHADASLMELVWNNLLSNAAKFTEKNGTVGVSLRQANGWAYVEISDSGCGMSEETTRHIFDKFYQGDTSHATEGNGLGLTLALRVLELMNGKLSVTSKLGVGTVFTVELPISEKVR